MHHFFDLSCRQRQIKKKPKRNFKGLFIADLVISETVKQDKFGKNEVILETSDFIWKYKDALFVELNSLQSKPYKNSCSFVSFQDIHR